MRRMDLEEALDDVPKRPMGTKVLRAVSRGPYPPRTKARVRREVAAASRQAAIRRWGPPRPIGVGEIKPASRHALAKGIAQLGMPSRYTVQGNRRSALVSYDAYGNVSMSQWDRNGNLAWNGIIGTIAMPTGTPAAVGNAVEAPIRRLIARTLRQPMINKDPSATGPDLVPTR